MIKILKPGMKNQITCIFCGAILQYDKEDVKEREQYITQRETDIVKYINCPQCKSEVICWSIENEVPINKSY